MTADEELTERSESDESPDDVPDDTPDDTDREPSHLDDLEDGSGCTEIWEHLSERREDEEEKE